MLKVRIDQIDGDGNVYRSFEFSRWPREIPDFLSGVERAYNMARTKVYVAGELVRP